MRTPVLLALSLLATQAAATPLQLNHQGRLADSAGTPLTGAHDLSLTLFDAPSGGAPLWVESETGVAFDSGFFSIDLGTSTPFDLDTMQHSAELWLELSVDGAPPLPARLPLQSVPYALVAARADVATSVAGGPVDATSLTVNGTSVVAEDGTIAWDRITGAPQQLGDLACGAAGQIPQWSGSAWSCVDPNAHDHSADQITSGTLSLDVIPIGTSQNTVSRGNHTHTALDLDLGPNGIDNPLNHDRYTDMEARTAVGQHYTDADAITAVGPHTPAYTNDMAIAAVGPHTPAYTNSMAIDAVGPHTPAYTDAMARTAVGPHYTDPEAIAAVEGEPTLALSGKVSLGTTRTDDALTIGGIGGTTGLGISFPSSPNDRHRIYGEHNGVDTSHLVLEQADNPDDDVIFRNVACCGGVDLDYMRIARNGVSYVGEGNFGVGTATPKAKLDVGGEIRSSEGISSQGNRVQRDILSWNTGANNAVPIHIKTNIKVHSNVMFRIAIEGYNYGVGASINSDTVGYPYVNYTCTGSAQNNNYANGVSISHYCSSDGYVVVKLTAGSFYYVGFTMSAFTLNPTGTAFDVTGTVYQQTADL